MKMTLEHQEVEHLFSYGTLQLEEVQLATFGRRLESESDILPGYRLVSITIQDEDFVAKSGTAEHRNLKFTGDSSNAVEGVVLRLTERELRQADEYEPEGTNVCWFNWHQVTMHGCIWICVKQNDECFV